MVVAASHRRALLAGAIASYVAVFGSLLVFESPGLGLGHFFYVPIVLVALATSGRWGAAAGAIGAGLYAVGIVLTPRVPADTAFTFVALIRAFTFSGVGLVVGWYASTNRALVERLTEVAARDFLTGLRNARAFDEALARQCAAGSSFLLVLADMDDLKRTNDAHGHEEGNRTIRRVAATLASNLGSGAEVARIGGDEFAILTERPTEEIVELVTAVTRALDREGLPTSFGWAAAPADGVVSVELFRKADDRLYAAKLLRRSRQSTLRVAAQERFVAG